MEQSFWRREREGESCSPAFMRRWREEREGSKEIKKREKNLEESLAKQKVALFREHKKELSVERVSKGIHTPGRLTNREEEESVSPGPSKARASEYSKVIGTPNMQSLERDSPRFAERLGKLKTTLVCRERELQSLRNNFRKLEELARQVHLNWQTELEKVQRMEHELFAGVQREEELKLQEERMRLAFQKERAEQEACINQLQIELAQSKQSEGADRLSVIEQKYVRLKEMVEESALAKTVQNRELETYKQGLESCFETFTSLFEQVLKQGSRGEAFAGIRTGLMACFDQNNVLLGKLGFQDKLVAILQTYQEKSRQASSCKKKDSSIKKKREAQEGWLGEEKRALEAEKENLARMANKGQRKAFREIYQEEDGSEEYTLELHR